MTIEDTSIGRVMTPIEKSTLFDIIKRSSTGQHVTKEELLFCEKMFEIDPKTYHELDLLIKEYKMSYVWGQK